jgi:hypothetical protein
MIPLTKAVIFFSVLIAAGYGLSLIPFPWRNGFPAMVSRLEFALNARNSFESAGYVPVSLKTQALTRLPSERGKFG